MANWEKELAVLLHKLGVTEEEPIRPATGFHSIESDEAGSPQEIPHPHPYEQPKRSDLNRWPRIQGTEREQERAVDRLFWRDGEEPSDDEDDAWLTDLSMMRRQVDTIVRQVIYLLQHGDYDISLKEDVMVVLRALRRRTSTTVMSEAAYLEFAIAMLHFCRLVLRLSEPAIGDM